MEWEGMSYEDAHSDGHGCGLLRLHIIDIAFDTGAGSGEPGGSGTGGSTVSCDASFGGDACCARSTGRAGRSICSGYTGVGERALRDAVYALGGWAGGG